MASRPTVVLIPRWGSGHFMSALEAGKKLLASGDGAFSLTVLVMHAPTQEKASEVEGHVRREAASGLDIRFIQLPAVEHPTDWVDQVEFVFRYVQLHAPHVKTAIDGLAPSSRVVAVVVDFFLTALFDVAQELSVPAYVYFTSPAAFLALMLRQNYDTFEYHGCRFMEARGVIVNTTVELEASVLAAIADGRCVPGRPAPALHAIGPVIWFEPKDDDQRQHECVQWLDAQPSASVVLLCFGSMGSHDAAQVREIAAGLERSGHRFLWVLRGSPVAGTRHPTDANLDELLPQGFLEATAGRGLVWPAWAPQREILSHAAVGGFVTHCGWNSVLESLWFGVPMVPWPLYGEQHLNAFELVAGVGVAVALDMDRKKGFFVEAAELERAVRRLMDGASEQGRKARAKASETSAEFRRAVGEGGSSCAALKRLVVEILNLPDGRK
ncbi:anthocyanidin 3-O-glucosyltransferase 2-like [Lolium rigidum]|uniref:anthocyanidin 3-O-glucosyltransferase 2-like n=1 Tax=Lolium rigidum TaxID=89674 RepID=UPI001F5D819F|nr:anthocyanidin 3-O-glucosyltransferase 2-like [Lolium rigidum]